MILSSLFSCILIIYVKNCSFARSFSLDGWSENKDASSLSALQENVQ